MISEKQQAGYYSIKWDGLNDNGLRVASGTYIYKIKAEGKKKSYEKSIKLCFIK
jgi:flagellar hook assembly protein FlgD